MRDHHRSANHRGAWLLRMLATANAGAYDLVTAYGQALRSDPLLRKADMNRLAVREVEKQSMGALLPTQAMQLLERVSQRSTIWSLVYQLDNGGLDVVMSRDYDTVHRFRL